MLVRVGLLFLLIVTFCVLILPQDSIMLPLKNIGMLLCTLSQGARAVTLQNAEDGFNTLQTWYNESNGLWVPSTGWWNSANCEHLLLPAKD